MAMKLLHTPGNTAAFENFMRDCVDCSTLDRPRMFLFRPENSTKQNGYRVVACFSETLDGYSNAVLRCGQNGWDLFAYNNRVTEERGGGVESPSGFLILAYEDKVDVMQCLTTLLHDKTVVRSVDSPLQESDYPSNKNDGYY